MKKLLFEMVKNTNFTLEKLSFSDEILAKAFDLLYGADYKAYLPIPLKAKEMNSVISGMVSPGVEFKKYVECIFFLEEQLQ